MKAKAQLPLSTNPKNNPETCKTALSVYFVKNIEHNLLIIVIIYQHTVTNSGYILHTNIHERKLNIGKP